MEIRIKSFSELHTAELYRILRLRCQVFVVEQDCVYQDIDDKDQKAIHVLGYEDDSLVAYARIFREGDYFRNISMGRVVVAPEKRSMGYGKTLIEACLAYIRENFKGKTMEISAQTYLLRFYTDLGFAPQGKEYLEDGIPHIRMYWSSSSGAKGY